MFQKEDNAFYRCWKENSDDHTKTILDQMNDRETADCFGGLPSFGTGGIRQAEGIGPNRINEVTIGWAAAALALSLKEQNEGKDLKKGVLIGFDTRKNSRFYAEKTALTLNAYGIPTLLFEEPVPVPLLSFVLKREDRLCGVMITASHNPGNYNGFKVYNKNGGQCVPEEAAPIQNRFLRTDPFGIPRITREQAISQGLFRTTGTAEEKAYLTAVTRQRFTDSGLIIVATPLHGAAFKLLPLSLKACGHHIFTVTSQEKADGSFPTVTAPNPEDPTAFEEAKTEGRRRNAHLLLATDGDGDRCGCGVRRGDGYHILTGNESAAVLLCYLLQRERDRLPQDAYIVRTAVSGTLGERVAAAYGVKTYITPTGFKHIGAMMNDPKKGTFFAGYEESGGFLYGNHAADKDGVAAAVLLAEAAEFYRRQGKTLLHVLNELYKKFGREYTKTDRFAFPGRDGATRREACLRWFKEHPLRGGNMKEEGHTLFFQPGEGIKTALRPSGTEPELKLYRIINADNDDEAERKNSIIDHRFLPVIHSFLPETDYSPKREVER
ncbi:MAG: phospho-sugar mutase [Clostridia bacterium]